MAVHRHTLNLNCVCEANKRSYETSMVVKTFAINVYRL